MMIQKRNSGVALLIVIGIIGLMGLAMIVLTATSNRLVFNTRQMRLDAATRNLQASAIAWARQNPTALSQSPTGEPTQLDAAKLNIRDGAVQVNVSNPGSGPLVVTVGTRCSEGPQRFVRQAGFSLTP